MQMGSAAPVSVTGMRSPPSRQYMSRRTRSAGPAPGAWAGARRDSSPVNTAVIGVVAIAPITKREPVPELPKSSASVRCGKAADADTVDLPGASAFAHDFGPEGPHGLGGVQHILGLQQAGNAGFAHRQRAQNERRDARWICRPAPPRAHAKGRRGGRVSGRGRVEPVMAVSSQGTPRLARPAVPGGPARSRFDSRPPTVAMDPAS